MSVLNANRRAVSAACRQSRKIHKSIVNQAAVLSPASVEQELEEISLQPIFDIFDAPARLSESREFIRENYRTTTPKAADVVPPPHPSSSRPRPGPAPLPSPIIFDGPARPKNEALAFQRRMRDAGLAPQPHPRRTPASSRTFSSSEPLVQLFDGPARITRYHHQSQSEQGNASSKNFVFALGVAGAIGCAALTQDMP